MGIFHVELVIIVGVKYFNLDRLGLKELQNNDFLIFLPRNEKNKIILPITKTFINVLL